MPIKLPKNLENRCLFSLLASHTAHLSYSLFQVSVPTSRKPQLRTHLLDQLTEAQQEWERQLSEQGQEHREQVDEVRRDLTQQQEALATLRRDITTLVEQQVRQVLTALEQLARDQAQDIARLHERLETFEQRIEQVEAAQITVPGYQQHANTQNQVIAELRAQLQEEVQARQRLSMQVSLLSGEKQRRKVDQP